MYFILDILISCISGMLLFVPIWVLVRKMAKRRVFGIHGAFVLLYAALLFAVFSVTGLPAAQYIRLDFTVNYIPFTDVLDSPVQYLMNILMFLPFGVLLPLLWERYGHWKNLFAFGFFLTIFIETAQVFTYRATDIDDLTANMLGICLGFWAVRRICGMTGFALPADQRAAEQDFGWTAYLVLSGTFSVWFFAGSYLSGLFWELVF